MLGSKLSTRYCYAVGKGRTSTLLKIGSYFVRKANMYNRFLDRGMIGLSCQDPYTTGDKQRTGDNAARNEIKQLINKGQVIMLPGTR